MTSTHSSPAGSTHARPGSASGRRVAVTGGAGFIGSALVDELVLGGDAVLVIDDLSSGTSASLPDAVTLENVDIAGGDLEGVIAAWRPDVVFHLAAQTSVPRSMDDPLRDLQVNVIGTHRVVGAARRAGASRLVFASSGGAVYGETGRPATEKAIPAPSSYYGAHKLAAESHVRLGGLSFAIVRPSNVYGPGQRAGLEGAVIASFVNRARAGAPLRIDGDGRQTRDFVHVSDVVSALQRLADPATPDGTWNVASGRSRTIVELAAIVERASGRSLGREEGPVRPGDIRHSRMSSSRLRALGWRPETGLAAGVRVLIRPSEGSSDQGRTGRSANPPDPVDVSHPGEGMRSWAGSRARQPGPDGEAG